MILCSGTHLVQHPQLHRLNVFDMCSSLVFADTAPYIVCFVSLVFYLNMTVFKLVPCTFLPCTTFAFLNLPEIFCLTMSLLFTFCTGHSISLLVSWNASLMSSEKKASPTCSKTWKRLVCCTIWYRTCLWLSNFMTLNYTDFTSALFIWVYFWGIILVHPQKSGQQITQTWGCSCFQLKEVKK